MADKNKKLLKNIKPAEVSKTFKNLNKIQKDISTDLYGFNKDIRDKNYQDFDKIKTSLKDVNEKYKEVTGDNTIEFFMQLSMDETRKLKKSNIKSHESNQIINNLSNAFNSPNNGFLAQLYVNEKSRLNRYEDYKIITKLIPQINQIVDIIADGIISPDDYSKEIFVKKYNDKTTSNINSEKTIFDNLKVVEKRYKIENKAKNIIKDTLINGDQFYTKLPLKREFGKMLAESYDPFLNEQQKILNESEVLLTEDERTLLNKSVIKKDDETISWEHEISKIVNENIEIVTKPLSLYESELSLLKEEVQLSEDVQTITQSFTTIDMAVNGTQEGKKRGRKAKDINIDGSYVKRLDPSKVVKLNIGSTCFGYYYIENETVENIVKPVNDNSLTRIVMGNNVDIPMEGIEQRDPKTLLISSIIGRNLSKKLNKQFLDKNKDFKKIIYELVKDEYLFKNKIRIVYFSPDEVTHFMVNEQENGYGQSILEPIIFTAKLYLATLTTTLMLKLTRSADHRTFYVETGLSKDVEETIQGVIRDIKTKEINLKDLNSIDTIFNNIGQFHDYFIPQINSEKAIDVEVTSGQDVTLENDLLEYLLKTMVSAMGVPANLIQMGEEVEFSRSLAMQNSKFLRYVVSTQKEFNPAFTEHYASLYQNEFSNNDENFSRNQLEICLPSPASLNYTNLSDQINSAQGIIDFIVDVIVGRDSPDAEYSDIVRRNVSKKYVSSIDWDSLDTEITTNIGLGKKTDLVKNLNNASSDESMSGGEEEY